MKRTKVMKKNKAFMRFMIFMVKSVLFILPRL